MGVFNRLVIQGEVFEDAELSAGMYAACKESAKAFESFGVWIPGAATATGRAAPSTTTSWMAHSLSPNQRMASGSQQMDGTELSPRTT